MKTKEEVEKKLALYDNSYAGSDLNMNILQAELLLDIREVLLEIRETLKITK